MATTARKKAAASVPAPRKRIVAEMEAITPEAAKALLKTNVSNRKLVERTINLYALDMQNGDWDGENGEAIKVAIDGTLLDGQHRLEAVVKAGVTVELLVVRGLARKAQETMDVGRKRSASDTFLLRGEANTTALSAILRRVVLWDKGDRKFREPVTLAEMSAKLEAYPGLRRSADVACRTNRAFKYLPTSSIGVAHHLTMQINGELAPWFFERIADGADLHTGHPVLVLRDRALRDVTQGNRANDVRALAYIIRAWNLYRKGETVTRLQHAPDAPVPDPH